MKKAAVLSLILCLTVTLVTVTPTLARANDFWPGVAIGGGSGHSPGPNISSPNGLFSQ